MKYKIQNTRILTSEELLTELHKSAVLYSKYADTVLLFICRENKADKYDFYEVRFGKNNFMHLAGIKSKMLSANEFYEVCLAGTVAKEHCNPGRNAGTMYSKVSVMCQLLDLSKSKCYKIGKKDLVTRDNDFEMATGNEAGVIGYDLRINTKASIPTTLLNNPITDYCSRPQKIMYILQRQYNEKAYKKVFYEIKKGLFEKEKAGFPDELKKLIEMQ